MEPTDNELKKELADGPLTRNGFNEHLRDRIRNRLDEQTAKRGRRLPWLGALGAALVALMLFASGVWKQAPAPAADETAKHDKLALATQAPAGGDTPPAHLAVRSAFLVGLRTDHPAAGSKPAYSSYRTLLIAPEADRPQLAAEGTGILMPYKQDFWEIGAKLTQEKDGEAETLEAYLASSEASLPIRTVVPSKPLKLEEKLVFAGNRYIAVDQRTDELVSGRQVRSEYAWVKEIGQLTGHAATPAEEPHVSLRDVLGPAAVQSGGRSQFVAAGESWTIARKAGIWTAMQAEYDQPAGGGYRFTLKEVPIALPESVVSHDELGLSWNEIRQLQPKAEDAFISPDKDMAVLVTQDSLLVYPLGNPPAKEPALKLSLSPGESVVMSQWATDTYVEQWKRLAKAYLRK